MLRIPHCLDDRLTDGGKVLSLTHRPHFTPQKHYYFSTSGTQGLVLPEGLGKVKKIINPIGSSVIPASRKRRRKGNPVVPDETVMYGYESSATLTTDRLHYKLQTRPLVREGAPRRRLKQLSGKRKEKAKSCHGPQRGTRLQDS
jgi:hypothetical protein